MRIHPTTWFVVFACTRLTESVTPIQKVIQMLNDMSAKGRAEKNNEEVEFAKFKTWCEDVQSDKTKDIAEAAAQIEQLEADIAKAESDAQVLGTEIADMQAEVNTWQADQASASALRDKEHTDYLAAHTDYSESVDAIERAIAALKRREADVPQSLLQVQNSNAIPPRAKAAIESFLALTTAQTPDANAYEFQSGGVVAMLEKLLHKFQDERFTLEKQEMNNNANFDLLSQKLHANIEDGEDTVSKKSAAKAGRLEDAAAAKGDLESTSTTKAQDEKTLSDTLTECASKSQEFEKNQVTRSDEVKAIDQATKILASPAVTGNAAKHLPTLVQTVSLFQLRSSGSGLGQTKAAVYLQARAKALGSRYLALVAARASADPFNKVKKMIKDLIVKLMEEANAEADHKGFCDTELATNKQTRENKAAEADELTAGVDSRTAERERLAREITELSDALLEIKKQQAEATAMREEEKARNAATVADAKEGQNAVEQALKVLKDFYSNAADPSLLQGQEQISQEMKEPYQGMQAESGGIVGFLEVILSDFARLESETSSNEDAAQSDYDKFIADSTEDAAVKQAEVDHKTSKKQQCEEALANLKKDLERTQEELSAALDYYEKLKPDCLDMGLSYEDRVAQRKEEVVSLQEALKILTGEEIA